MTFSDFIVGLLDIVFFCFDKTDNIVVFVPTFCLFFCFCFIILRRLYHTF